MSQEPLNPQLAALAGALKELRPQPTDWDRDRLMFQAGQAAATVSARSHRVAWLWPCAAAANFLLAVALGALLMLRGGSQSVEQIAGLPASGAAISSAGTPDRVGLAAEYLRLRRQVLEYGADALSERKGNDDRKPAATAPSGQQRELLRELLNS